MSGLELNASVANKQTTCPFARVKEIDSNSIKLLAAGEKINDIETAIRELIENSVDAGADNIEIRLAKFGVDSIEVEDNGIGIDENDFKYLGMRYHTSKIKDYKNFQESLETFGFRGEALSCLSTIATVTITTKTKSSPHGWKLTFKKDGTFAKSEPIGRTNGTTVALRNLFHLFPVRRKELEKNAKRQYDKIVRLIYEQALAKPYIKFSLSKKNGTKKEKDFTHGGTTLEGCLITIFGIKLLDTIMPIKQLIKGQLLQLETNKIPIKQDSKSSELEQATSDDSKAHVRTSMMAQTCASFKVEQIKDEKLSDPLCTSATCTTSTTTNAAIVQSQFVGQTGESLEQQQQATTSTDNIARDVELPEAATQLVLANTTIDNNSLQAISTQPRDEFFKRSCRSKFARTKPNYKIYGYISKIGHGRNSSDGQFIFVNGKPFQTWAADFNVPRKRFVILQEDNKLCDLVRESLEEMYSSFVPAMQKSCPIAQIPFVSTPRPSSTQQSGGELFNVGKISGISTKLFIPSGNATGSAADTAPNVGGCDENIIGRGIATGASSEILDLNREEKEVTTNSHEGVDHIDGSNPVLNDSLAMGNNVSSETYNTIHATSIIDPFEVGLKRLKKGQKTIASSTTQDSNDAELNNCFIKSPHFSNITKTTFSQGPSESNHLPGFQNGLDLLIEELGTAAAVAATTSCGSTSKSSVNNNERPNSPTSITSTTTSIVTNKRQFSPDLETNSAKKTMLNHVNGKERSETSTDIIDDPYGKCRFNQINAKVNGVLQASLQFIEDLSVAHSRERVQRKISSDTRQFSFAIHPKFNTPAEEELKFHLNKRSFSEMQVVGQFNKGFIITRLNKHLFIIDQHATDERANFEQQLDDSPLIKQSMVYPKPLYLNLIQENAILNNMESFLKRGFEFKVDRSKLIGYRVMLSATSICKGPTKDEHLDKEDIEELIDVAIESPNRLESYVLSKVRNVSASVACRKSVMIGDSLTWQQMSSIVGKMCDLKNPWVCAHNRPTIRHLMDVDWMSMK